MIRMIVFTTVLFFTSALAEAATVVLSFTGQG
jgi:hypothetical protein